MNLNVVTLARVLKELPEPTHPGQVIEWAFPTLEAELNRDCVLVDDYRPDAVMGHRVQFVAVRLHVGRHNEWLEWELIA